MIKHNIFQDSPVVSDPMRSQAVPQGASILRARKKRSHIRRASIQFLSGCLLLRTLLISTLRFNRNAVAGEQSEQSITEHNRIEQNISQPNKVDQSRVTYHGSQDIFQNVPYTKSHHIWEGPADLGEGPEDLWEGHEDLWEGHEDLWEES